MKAALLYKIAAVLFVLFAAGHTVGFLTLKPPTPESQAVFDGMNNVHFEMDGHSFSYGGFYRGFGISITIQQLFSAFLSWYLAGLAARQPGAIGALGWVFFAVQVAGLALSCMYFPAVPAILSGVVAAVLGWAAARVRVA